MRLLLCCALLIMVTTLPINISVDDSSLDSNNADYDFYVRMSRGAAATMAQYV